MTDQELARRAQRGDSESFVELAHRHQHRLYRLAYRFSGSADKADDLCQECLIRAFRQINRYDSERPFLPWFMRVSANVCLRWHGGGDMRRRDHLVSLSDDLFLPSDDDVEQEVFSRMEKQRVLTTLNTLPEETRLLIVMRFVLGLTFREISEQTGVKLPTVAFRVTRGLEILRSKLCPEQGVSEQ